MAGTSILEGRGPREVLQQDLALRFVLAANKAQPQEKAAESVLVIVGFLSVAVTRLAFLLISQSAEMKWV